MFAYLIGNWNNLARIVFESFAGLGLKASGTGLSSADFLRPGRIAQVGIDAGRPILDSISGLMGYISFFENFIQIVVLLFAWVIVLLAFFILAIQLFVTLIEFKLTTLAGFVLIPFGLFGKTAFAAERVLGNVISSGVKVMVLAVIVGIGSTLFSQFTSGFGGNSRPSKMPWPGARGAVAAGPRNLSGPVSPTASSPAARSSAPAPRRNGACCRRRDCGRSGRGCRWGWTSRRRIRRCREGYDGYCRWSGECVSDGRFFWCRRGGRFRCGKPLAPGRRPSWRRQQR